MITQFIGYILTYLPEKIAKYFSTATKDIDTTDIDTDIDVDSDDCSFDYNAY